jgi:ABC-type proline/glycine betaine transport system ATPase subunit
MDPEARRFMWTVVAGIAQRKTSAVVLTTHSMDEAEALSTKMGIMIKGGIFQCFGSSQHIKNKFGTGFVVEIKVRSLEESELESVEKKLKISSSGEIDLSQFKFDEKIKGLVTAQTETLTAEERTRRLHGDLNLYKCINELCLVFQQVDLLEKFGNYIKVRFAKQKESIGTVFGLIEKMKQNYDVSEYSVGQTTLEQIF